MPNYVTLAEFTEKAVDEIDRSTELFDQLREYARSKDGAVHDVYVTFGEYDMVVVSEFPDDKSCAQFALTMAEVGGLDTETLKGFTEDEYEAIVAGLAGTPAGPHGNSD